VSLIQQWWPLVVFNIWARIATPSIVLLITAVLVINLGGVYNCIAYTVIRRRLQQRRRSRSQQVVVRDDGMQLKTVNIATVAMSSTLSVAQSQKQDIGDVTDDDDLRIPISSLFTSANHLTSV
jgi:hypothetical protein